MLFVDTCEPTTSGLNFLRPFHPPGRFFTVSEELSFISRLTKFNLARIMAK